MGLDDGDCPVASVIVDLIVNNSWWQHLTYVSYYLLYTTVILTLAETFDLHWNTRIRNSVLKV